MADVSAWSGHGAVWVAVTQAEGRQALGPALVWFGSLPFQQDVLRLSAAGESWEQNRGLQCRQEGRDDDRKIQFWSDVQSSVRSSVREGREKQSNWRGSAFVGEPGQSIEVLNQHVVISIYAYVLDSGFISADEPRRSRRSPQRSPGLVLYSGSAFDENQMGNLVKLDAPPACV